MDVSNTRPLRAEEDVMDKQPNKIKGERDGTDELYRFMVVCCVLLVLLRLVFRRGVVSFLTLGLGLVWGVLTVLRPLSRNLPARRAENRLFLLFCRRMREAARLILVRIRDHDRWAYRRCPCCRAVMRLRRKRGEHTLLCPRCGEKFDVHIR